MNGPLNLIDSIVTNEMEKAAPRRHEECYIDIFQPISEREKALVSIGGTDAIFRSDITVICGGEGVGKTAFLRPIIAACLGEREVLGITAEPGLRLHVHDTEQDITDIIPGIDGALRLAGIPREKNEDLEKRLIVTTTRRKNRDDVEEIFTEIVEDNKSDIIILDGIGDLILDVNDIPSVNRLVGRMLSIVDTYNVSLICILHTNPTDPTGKVRGNLGSELMRKAKCIILLSYDENNNCFKVSCKKARRKRFSPFYFTRDDSGQVITVEAPTPKERTMNTRDRIYLAMEPAKTYDYETLYQLFTDVDRSTVRHNVGELLKDSRITTPAKGKFMIK